MCSTSTGGKGHYVTAGDHHRQEVRVAADRRNRSQSGKQESATGMWRLIRSNLQARHGRRRWSPRRPADDMPLIRSSDECVRCRPATGTSWRCCNGTSRGPVVDRLGGKELIVCGRTSVDGVEPRQPALHPATAVAHPRQGPRPELRARLARRDERVERTFTDERVDQLWLTDITETPPLWGCSTVRDQDACSRRIVGCCRGPGPSTRSTPSTSLSGGLWRDVLGSA